MEKWIIIWTPKKDLKIPDLIIDLPFSIPSMEPTVHDQQPQQPSVQIAEPQIITCMNHWESTAQYPDMIDHLHDQGHNPYRSDQNPFRVPDQKTFRPEIEQHDCEFISFSPISSEAEETTLESESIMRVAAAVLEAAVTTVSDGMESIHIHQDDIEFFNHHYMPSQEQQDSCQIDCNNNDLPIMADEKETSDFVPSSNDSTLANINNDYDQMNQQQINSHDHQAKAENHLNHLANMVFHVDQEPGKEPLEDEIPEVTGKKENFGLSAENHDLESIQQEILEPRQDDSEPVDDSAVTIN